VTAGGSVDYDIAIFFVSSIYEASAYKYNCISETLSKHIPAIKFIVGSTTGGVIGPAQASSFEPSEIEARASFGITLLKLDDDIKASAFSLTGEDVAKYIKNANKSEKLLHDSNADEGAVALLFATDNVKSRISSFVDTLGERENVEAFGAVASSVTSLHVPKVFYADIAKGQTELLRSMNGVVGLVLSGNVKVQTVAARTVTPVGPLFSISEANGRDIMQLKVCVSCFIDSRCPLRSTNLCLVNGLGREMLCNMCGLPLSGLTKTVI
jgi:hypothetical protein